MIKPNRHFFIDVDYLSEAGYQESTAGSVFRSSVPQDKLRVLCVLAQGEGSGIKASVPASLAATMALRLAENGTTMEQIAELVLHSPEKKFIEQLHSPSFSVLIISSTGSVEILEFGHPPIHLYRLGEDLPIERRANALFDDLNKTVLRSRVQCMAGDRILLFTDSFAERFGSLELMNHSMKKIMAADPDISSRELIHALYRSSFEKGGQTQTGGKNLGSFTLASMFLRKPRKLIIATGAPFDKGKDPSLAQRMKSFEGRKAVCGGTTAKIIGRELDIRRNVIRRIASILQSDYMKEIDIEYI